MSISKPLPLRTASPQRCCPVCGKVSYSAGGIHPQCAAQRAAASLDAISLAAAVEKREQGRPKQPWSKTCPKCRRELAARRAVCDCGHSFLLAKSGSHD